MFYHGIVILELKNDNILGKYTWHCNFVLNRMYISHSSKFVKFKMTCLIVGVSQWSNRKLVTSYFFISYSSILIDISGHFLQTKSKKKKKKSFTNFFFLV